MKVFDQISAACALAKAKKKPVLFLSFPTSFDSSISYTDLLKAVPYLNWDQKNVMQAISDGHAFIVCDSDKERDRLYNLTVGDDGPTKTNKYKGPVRVYALTIDRTGQTLNENT